MCADYVQGKIGYIFMSFIYCYVTSFVLLHYYVICCNYKCDQCQYITVCVGCPFGWYNHISGMIIKRVHT